MFLNNVVLLLSPLLFPLIRSLLQNIDLGQDKRSTAPVIGRVTDAPSPMPEAIFWLHAHG
jgi:hypothetical protein